LPQRFSGAQRALEPLFDDHPSGKQA
jgi:hypothetical protein